ncbi:MAG: FtsX-like permease family protein [Cyclobacteriaceae bacterium]|nr:FtsX-like permease family protein [Cyclobacteriaceae bacterium]
MIRNYLKVAIRNLTRNGVYSFINIVGLAVGLSCSILISLWVFDELSYDRFQPKLNRLSQLWINATYDGKVNTFQSVPYPSYLEIRNEDSRIKNTTIANWGGESLLTAGEKRMSKKSFYVGEEFLEMFQFQLLFGQADKVLDDPNSIVLTVSTAKALFGTDDPIGKLVKVDNAKELTVTGILEDVPANSSFEFDCLMPHKLQSAQIDENSNWGDYSFQVFIELQQGVALKDVNEKIKGLLVKKGQTDVPREFFLHPMERWRLHTSFENGKESGGTIDYVIGFSAIAIFILVIACINFMNLATARSERRAREVGVRKSIGSRRRDLIVQFLGESILLTTIGFALCLVLVELSLPFYNNLTQKKLFLDYSSPLFWTACVGIVLLTGIISGSYPAIYLSSFNPVKVLKGKLQVGKSAATPRQVLVVLQFFFATLLIVSTLVVSEQIRHVKKRDLGYNQKNLMMIPYSDDIGKNFRVIRNEVVATGAVSSMTKSNSPITDIYSNNFMSWPGKPEEEKVLFATIATELDYTKTMGIKILEGRDVTGDADTASVLINKAAADVMNLKETLGTEVVFWGDRKCKIIGVLDNVLMGSPYRKASPMFVAYFPEWASSVTLRLEETADLPSAVNKIEEVFKKYNPAYPFTYQFADVEFNKKYTAINLISKLANLFAFLAILITGLGLFGLAAFTAEQRTKEIGIRKVMGASVPSLVTLISKEFSLLVAISFVFAVPFSWWTLSSFLERYPYRIDFPWWTVVVAGGTALLFALAIVSTQALKAATSNPASSLRSE